ncbi:MAG TPA: FAD-linked oxidase C-terminal domain-containing protein [Ktedonobacteraceae bacterium]
MALQEHELRSLQTLLPRGQVFTDRASLISYEVDAGMDRGVPEGVVFPRSADEVARVVRWAAEHAIPLIARGAGTGLSGGAVAERGGIIVEFSRMQHILDIDEHGRIAVVEPAVINLVLDEQVKTKGLYFPPDPASQRASTIGGNVAENSGGPHCFKYGVTSNYVIGLDVVLADGRRVRVGGRALDYPEYDLCGLLTGSEGMLALITAITARLVRNPPAVKTLLAVFDSVEQAGKGVSAIIAAGLVPATMEMMDQKIIQIVEPFAHAGLPTDAQAILIIDVDGYPASLDRQVDDVAQLLQAHGARNLRISTSAEERNQIWFARKSAAGAIARLAPAYYTVDITVPRSRLTETLFEVNQVCDKYGLRVGYVFHAGDGNLHPLILIPDPEDRDLLERVHSAGREVVELAVSKGGSLSGEHGVGIEKRQYMSLMFNNAELSAMRDVKEIFDPHNVLNPGKVFPSPSDRSLTPDEDARRGGSGVEQGGDPWVAQSFPPHDNTRRGGSGVEQGGDACVAQSTPTEQEQAVEHILSPATAEDAAMALLSATKARRQVYIRSCPETLDEQRNSLVLSTARLKGMKTYAADDLYITVGAGTTLDEIQTFLAPDQKQVPLATLWPEATIGGLIAANVNAPLRMRYGAVRDLVLCATVALTDGRIIRAGRPVIKNVAGFDLVKAFVGSHGTLGLITDATLKLVVKPRTQRTLLIQVDDYRYGLVWAGKLLPMALVASAIMLCKECVIPKGAPISASPFTLVYTAEGITEDVEAELDQVRQVLRTKGGPESLEVEGLSGTDIWAASLAGSRGTLLVRAGVAAKDVAAYINDQAAALNEEAFLADMSSGLVYAVASHMDAVEEAGAWLEKLRQPAVALDGYAVVMDMPEDWQGKIDRWGYQPQAVDLMRRLKGRWDPEGILI